MLTILYPPLQCSENGIFDEHLEVSEFHHISNSFLLNISPKSQKFPGLFKFYPVVKKILSRMLFNVRAILNLGPFIALAERT